MKLRSFSSLVAGEGYEFMAVSAGGWQRHANAQAAIEGAVRNGSPGRVNLYRVISGDPEAKVNMAGYVTWTSESDRGSIGFIGTLIVE